MFDEGCGWGLDKSSRIYRAYKSASPLATLRLIPISWQGPQQVTWYKVISPLEAWPISFPREQTVKLMISKHMGQIYLCGLLIGAAGKRGAESPFSPGGPIGPGSPFSPAPDPLK